MIASLAATPQALAQTDVIDDVVADTTWTRAASPYAVALPITVAPGATLTLEPGVEVRFDAGAGLLVHGVLAATGTAASPIVLRGAGSGPGSWEGVRIEGSAALPATGSRLEHVHLVDAGGGGGNLVLYEARVTVRDSVIATSSTAGIRVGTRAAADVSRTTFGQNAGAAVEIEDLALDPELTGLSATGNGTDAVLLWGGVIEANQSWEPCGLPYQVLRGVDVADGATLVIQAGVEVRFDDLASLWVAGTLQSTGSATAPVTLTGVKPVPGSWSGVVISGTPDARNEGSVLEYTTIEFAGQEGASLQITSARVKLSRCTLRQNGADAVRAEDAGGSVIEATRIVDVPAEAFGVEAYGADPIFAQNDWWGAASGPLHDTCNTSGTGARVTSTVYFVPFLTSADANPGAIPDLGGQVLTVTPQRWYVPADGTEAWMTVTLRDASGVPVPGMTVSLASTLGAVTDGGITDVQGQTFATISSDAPGLAQLSATLDVNEVCTPYRPGKSTITFTDQSDNPMTEDQAPYLTDAIEIVPEPVTQGVPTKVRATLQNDNTFPVLVDATFRYADYGIGLVFGPLGTVTAQRIEAKSTGVLEIDWLPVLSGHYCISLDYSVSPATASALTRGSALYHAGLNLDALAGSVFGSREKNAAEKARLAVDVMGKGMGRALPKGLTIPTALFMKILDFNFDTWGAASDILGGGNGDGTDTQGGGDGSMGDTTFGDPGDYTDVASVSPADFTPTSPDGEISADVAADADAVVRSAIDATAYLGAMTLSQQRAAAAAEAGETTWVSQQTAAVLYYKAKAGVALVTFADALDVLVADLGSLGGASWSVSRADGQAFLDRLRAQGFTSDERAAATLLGISGSTLEVMRQRWLLQDASKLVGDLLSAWAGLSPVFRELGAAFIEPPRFTMPSSARGALTADAGNLARLGEQKVSFAVGNPLTAPATVTLVIRRLDVPADWMLTLSSAKVALPAGGRTNVTLTVQPGAAVPQGTRPRVAVEGYIQGQLVGGVVVDTLVPTYVAVGTTCTGAGDRAPGHSCACAMDCQAGLTCLASGSASTCTPTCGPAGSTCGAGTSCVASTGGPSVCLAPPAETLAESGGGCTAGAPAASLILVAALLLPLVRRRRGRRLSAGTPPVP